MTLNDIKGAVEDLTENHGHKPTSTVYLHGEKRGINGIDEIDGKLYVLSQDGKPAVSNAEYERLNKRLGVVTGWWTYFKEKCAELEAEVEELRARIEALRLENAILENTLRNFRRESIR